MTQDKMRKIITASVVACTTLFVFLLIILLYQWITIGVYNNRIEKTQAEIDALAISADEKGELAEYYEELNETAQSDLDYYSSDLYKKLEAFKLGFINGQGDK